MQLEIILVYLKCGTPFCPKQRGCTTEIQGEHKVFP